MKKIIRLTERDLNRIVRRVVNEQDEPDYCTKVDDKLESKNFTGFMFDVDTLSEKINYMKTTCDFEKYALMVFRLKDIVDREISRFDTFKQYYDIDVNNLKNDLRQRYDGFIK
jgi:hypothetical protein